MENQVPQITTSEIEEWEKRFKESVSPQVRFTKDEKGNTFTLYNGDNGIEALWAGVVIMNNDYYIKWSFSIQNDPTIDAKMNLNEENFTIIQNLYNFYNTWKGEWSKQMSVGNDPQAGPSNMSDTGTLPNPPGTPVAGIPPASTNDMSQGGGMAGMQENSRTKMNIIENQSDRMRRLAGLL